MSEEGVTVPSPVAGRYNTGVKLRHWLLIPVVLAAVGSVLVFGARCQSVKVQPDSRLTAYDDEPWRAVTTTHVHGGLVDYVGLRRDHESDLNQYVDAVGRFGPNTTPESFPTDADRLAYHLNAYNAIMLHKWLDAGAGTPEFDATSKVNTAWFFFDLWKVDGRRISLNDLEQKVIRPTFGDFRIHFALVCGAMSCPPLLDEPFVGDRLDAQFDGLGRRWLTEPDGLRVADDGDTVELSSIFQWYAADFEAAGGLRSIIEKHLADDDDRYTTIIEALDAGRVRYLDYDWTINQSPPGFPDTSDAPEATGAPES